MRSESQSLCVCWTCFVRKKVQRHLQLLLDYCHISSDSETEGDGVRQVRIDEDADCLVESL